MQALHGENRRACLRHRKTTRSKSARGSGCSQAAFYNHVEHVSAAAERCHRARKRANARRHTHHRRTGTDGRPVDRCNHGHGDVSHGKEPLVELAHDVASCVAANRAIQSIRSSVCRRALRQYLPTATRAVHRRGGTTIRRAHAFTSLPQQPGAHQAFTIQQDADDDGGRA
jgi:hypothetical protein